MTGPKDIGQFLHRFGRYPEQGTPFTYEEAHKIMAEVRAGHARRTQMAALLMGWHVRGITAPELRASLDVWQEEAPKLEILAPVLQVASGFAGQIRTIDLTLPASLVAAAAGARVLLMGGDSMAPYHGITSGDLLRALGIKTTLQPGEIEASLATIGWAYGYFPILHPKLHRIGLIRADLGIPTMLEPLEQLIAPVGHKLLLLSVSSYPLGGVVAEVLRSLDIARAAVVLGEENSTDLPLSHPVTLWEVRGHTVSERTFNPREFGVEGRPVPGPQGVTLKELARMYEEILSGNPHPYREAVQFNAAHQLYTAGIASDFHDAMRRANDALMYGTAYRKLREFRSSFALK